MVRSQGVPVFMAFHILVTLFHLFWDKLTKNNIQGKEKAMHHMTMPV